MSGLLRRRTVKLHRGPRRRVNMAELKRLVVERDRECVAYKLGFPHECRDMIGTLHRPDAVNRLSLEHVKLELRMGVRADDDPEHTVALCYGLNMQPPSKEMRAAFREYLAGLAG